MVPTQGSCHRGHTLDRDLLRVARSHRIGRTKRYRKGDVLYGQGDPVEYIFLVERGAIKLSCAPAGGGVHTFNVLGPGGLRGLAAFLLGGCRETSAEAMEVSEVLVFTPAEFQNLLITDPQFALLVMRKMAEDCHRLSAKVRGLGLSDVQQRLKSSLLDLASEYGVATEKGIRIDLDITHQEIAELVAANRTTITTALNELKKQGYLWNEGRRLFILPPELIEILDSLEKAIIAGSAERAHELAREVVRKKQDPLKALEVLANSMRQVDRMFARGEMDVTDVNVAACAAKSTIAIIGEEIENTSKSAKYLVTIVLGTVYGDTHDIGRLMVSLMLKARGFKVIDLGANVRASSFVEAVRCYRPQVLAISSFTYATNPELAKVIKALEKEDLRKQLMILVGGNAVTQRLSEQVGADWYERSARRAADLAWRLAGSLVPLAPSIVPPIMRDVVQTTIPPRDLH
jgi:5-methyltetrahydrofolate--homocysteine methyltransferase